MNRSVRGVRNSCSLIVRSYATRTRKSNSLFSPKPGKVPFQPKLANAVNLIGQVQTPIQFQDSPDGNAWAATVITRQHSPTSPYLSIPVIFEGDLAHTAACHLKQNDFIHILGQLSTDPPHLEQHQHQTNIQVMVQTLNFVQGYPQLNNTSAISTKKISPSEEQDINPSRTHIHAKQSDEHDIDKSWKDLLDNPMEWWDLRSEKENPKGAAFERKTNGELLFINNSTPKWLQDKLGSMTIDLKPEPKLSICNNWLIGLFEHCKKNAIWFTFTASAKKNPDSSLSSWTDLLNNPSQWWDFRDSKLNGLVVIDNLSLDTNPRHPDFKCKDGSASFWLNRAPTWVLPKLKGLEFDVPVAKSKKAKDCKGGESWNDLVQNPAKWWDNRLDKRNEKSPDFKHKETGEGLWLGASPSWVLSKLPPPKPKQSAETGRKQTLFGIWLFHGHFYFQWKLFVQPARIASVRKWQSLLNDSKFNSRNDLARIKPWFQLVRCISWDVKIQYRPYFGSTYLGVGCLVRNKIRDELVQISHTVTRQDESKDGPVHDKKTCKIFSSVYTDEKYSTEKGILKKAKLIHHMENERNKKKMCLQCTFVGDRQHYSISRACGELFQPVKRLPSQHSIPDLSIKTKHSTKKKRTEDLRPITTETAIPVVSAPMLRAQTGVVNNKLKAKDEKAETMSEWCWILEQNFNTWQAQLREKEWRVGGLSSSVS
ncbi:Protein OSB3, chloroplastic/mitochondrial, partial [Mucuna pruriens]